MADATRTTARVPGTADGLRGVLSAMYGSGVVTFWFLGSEDADWNPVPGREFVVNDLAAEPVKATWVKDAPAGGPLFCTFFITHEFDGEAGR
ncbi:hypothetical protein ACIBSV_49690, partial [Embleya sp. NPDC050154]|uniref:hypothetical protein n=1 Tax=Embleya sp. NPDC050154 TaxID=3363988 RepID=UPI00379AF1D7